MPPNRTVTGQPMTRPSAAPRRGSTGTGQAPTDPSVRVSQPNQMDPSTRVSGIKQPSS
jgi:hypothetical protein